MAEETGNTSPDTSVASAADAMATLFASDTASTSEEETEEQHAEEQSSENAEDEETQDAEDSTEETDQGKRKLKLTDGTEVDEEEAVKGYLRQADYTRKTQAVAEERKKIDAELRPKLEATVAMHKRLEEAILSVTPKEPDWNAKRKELEPAEFAAAVAEWQLHEGRMAKIAESRKKAEEELAASDRETARINGEAAYARLLEIIPEWKDTAKRNTERDAILKYVEPLGLTAKELAQVTKPEFFVILRDASRYKQLTDKTKSKPPGTQKAATTTVLKPGSANAQRPRAQTEVVKALDKVAKSGNVVDAGKAMKALGL